MREILFRAKRIKDGVWFEGMLDKITVEKPSATKIRYKIVEYNYGYSDDGSFEPTYTSGFSEEIDAKTIGQFTGLTDKNGRKIFEGDIVTGLFSFGLPINAVVTFQDGAFGLEWCSGTVGRFTAFTSLCNTVYEIVGNIHDNPELMQQ